MTGHPRLYRRNATYYHRAAVPVDIKETYPKTEETFSLGTKDYAEALKLVRISAVMVDELFDSHRQQNGHNVGSTQASHHTEIGMNLSPSTWREHRDSAAKAAMTYSPEFAREDGD